MLHKRRYALYEWYYSCMHDAPIFEWEGREYVFEEKSTDWYWALGIIATAVAIAAILFGNVLLALVVIAGAVTIALAAAKSPRVHRFGIYEIGIMIDETLYPYESMLHFSVLEYADETLPPSLSIKTKQFLAPHLLIPIVGHDPVEIYEYVLNHLPDGGHERSLMDGLVRLFRL